MFATPRLLPFTRAFIIAVFALYIIELLALWRAVDLMPILWLAPFSVANAWQVFTHGLASNTAPGAVGGVLIGFVFIWWMVSPFEERWGRTRAAQLVAVAIIGSSLGGLLMGGFALLVRLPLVPSIGTSCITLAAMAAFAATLKNAQISFFGAFPMRATTMITISIVYAAVLFLADRSLVGLGVSLGALGSGYAFGRWMIRPRIRTGKPHLRVVSGAEPPRYIN